MNFEKLSAFLDSFLDMGMPMYDCVVYQNHERVFRKWGGFFDRDAGIPLAGNEKFHVFSCSKPVTGAAVLTLLEEGRIALSDPLSKYFPGYRSMNVLETAEDGTKTLRPAKEEITLRHLFQMSCGIDYELDFPALQKARAEKGEDFTASDMAEALSKKPLLFDPGVRWEYSLSHDILGGVAEVVTGKLFGDFVKERIFLPLGMENTDFRRTPLETDRVPRLYDNDCQPVSGFLNRYIFSEKHHPGGAGILSTPEDYILFNDAMASWGVGKNGVRILKKETVELLRTTLLPDSTRFRAGMYKGFTYALGVATLTHPTETLAHTPKGIFGWNGAGGSMSMISPDTGVSLFCAHHFLGTDKHKLYQPLIDATFEGIFS